MNKYEMVMIAAREARRLNELAKLSGRELKRRPTSLAWELLHSGRIKYTYEAELFDVEKTDVDPLAEPEAPAEGSEVEV